MDTLQKAQLQVSEVKTKITNLLELLAEQRAEDFDGDLVGLTKEVKSAEVALQAALLAQPEPDKAVEKRSEVVETSEEKAEVELRTQLRFPGTKPGTLDGKRRRAVVDFWPPEGDDMRVSLHLSAAEVQALQRVAKTRHRTVAGEVAWAGLSHIKANGYVEPQAPEPTPGAAEDDVAPF